MRNAITSVLRRFQNWSLLFVLLLSFAVKAQDTGFTLSVTATDETCLGNGTLTFHLENTIPEATYNFTVFQLPDLVNPIAFQTSNFLGGRSGGTYRIVATQILNGVSTTQAVEVTINTAFTPFTFTLSGTPAICGDDGTLNINVTSGIGTQYEIISGPVTRPLQSSSLFGNLPPGVYEVRAFDQCNNGYVATHTILLNPSDLTISGVGFPPGPLPTCDQIEVTNLISAAGGSAIPFPITATYVVHPPTGPDITFTQTQNSAGGSFGLTQVIPFYYDTVYTYDLTVVDGCGRTWIRNNNVVNERLSVSVVPELLECGNYKLTVVPAIFTYPIQIEIINAPSDFDPTHNPTHPGPFTGNIEYGDLDNPVPVGEYTIRITDGCGHTAEGSTTITEVPIEPNETITPYPGCQSNHSDVTIELPGLTIVDASIEVAPDDFGQSLPLNVASFIDPDEGLVLINLIEGHYVVHLVDECGDLYISEFDVPPLNTSVSFSARPDCELGKGSMRLRGNGMKLTSVIITAAPEEFGEELPFDASAFITAEGILSMNALPPGQYSFHIFDECGDENTLVNQNVQGFEITSSNVEITPHCGSFDITLNHLATGTSQSFWLQKWNESTETWGHPQTGVAYPEGTVPNNNNSLALQNNFTTYSLIFLGDFRIVKRFEAFADGSSGSLFRDCISIIHEFTFDGSFGITGFEKMTCDGALADIKVLANGVPPMTYRITHKNNEPFVIDNGTNNIFSGLEPAVYTFEVQQLCGDIAQGQANIAELPSQATATQPDNLVLCDDSSADGIETFTLTDVIPQLLNGADPDNFQITFHLSAVEAAVGANPLPSIYTSGNKTIFVRMVYLANPACFDTTSFELIVNPYPVPGLQSQVGFCPGSPTVLSAGPGFDSYLWSTGQTSSSITVFTPGNYSVEVSKTLNGVPCTATYSVEVLPSEPPVLHEIVVEDWTDNDNTITVVLENASSDFLYSLDNVHFQSENIFENLLPGVYTVYIKDVDGCTTIQQEVHILSYPKFFTPNGDGYNDFWKVKFSHTEPSLKTYIFDRYGKLITGFGTDSPGWDGTYNGERLPSTDYWFVVVRENGKIFRGHFAMKR